MNTIAILGATGGVGRALAQRLVESHVPVLLVGRNSEKLAQLQSQLRDAATVCKLEDFSSSDMLRVSIEQALGGKPLGGIVNCVGSLLLKPAHATSDAEFRETLETNLFTAFAAVRVAGALLRKSGGSVVLLATAAADIGIANHEAIAAAKAGITGLARAAAATYANNNVRINVVSPGLIRTELTKSIWSNPASQAASVQMHALGRLGTADQVASLIAWLLNPVNDWTTGQVFHVDGGLSRVVPRPKVAAS